MAAVHFFLLSHTFPRIVRREGKRGTNERRGGNKTLIQSVLLPFILLTNFGASSSFPRTGGSPIFLTLFNAPSTLPSLTYPALIGVSSRKLMNKFPVDEAVSSGLRSCNNEMTSLRAQESSSPREREKGRKGVRERGRKRCQCKKSLISKRTMSRNNKGAVSERSFTSKQHPLERALPAGLREKSFVCLGEKSALVGPSAN